MKKLTPYFLLVPQIIVGIIFLLGIVIGVTWSFGVIPIFGMYVPTFKYYKEIFARADTISSILYSIKISGISSILAIIIGVFLCYIMLRTGKNKGFTLLITKLPILVPHIIVALVLVNIISANGLLARLCYQIGLIKEQTDFPLLVYDKYGIGVVFAYLWKEVPFVIYFTIALMSGISESLGEAAINLGARSFESFFKVTLPLCYNTIMSAFLIIFTYSLGAYELPLLMGATIPKALPIMTYIEFQKPDLRMRTYAMAYNGILIIISLIASLIYFLLISRSSKELRRDEK